MLVVTDETQRPRAVTHDRGADITDASCGGIREHDSVYSSMMLRSGLRAPDAARQP